MKNDQNTHDLMAPNPLDAGDGTTSAPSQIEILAVDDDCGALEAVAALLESEGYAVRRAGNGAEALALFRERRPNLVLLDVRMPGKNGYHVCEEMRAMDLKTPIIFRTAKDSSSDELRGLLIGADDYISKTVRNEVLLARIETALSRVSRIDAAGSPGDFDFGAWRVDSVNFRLVAHGRTPVELLFREVQMLRLFRASPGILHTRDALLSKFWGTESYVNDHPLSCAIHRLREKLGPDAPLIELVYGQGYRYRGR